MTEFGRIARGDFGNGSEECVSPVWPRSLQLGIQAVLSSLLSTRFASSLSFPESCLCSSMRRFDSATIRSIVSWDSLKPSAALLDHLERRVRRDLLSPLDQWGFIDADLGGVRTQPNDAGLFAAEHQV